MTQEKKIQKNSKDLNSQRKGKTAKQAKNSKTFTVLQSLKRLRAPKS